MSNHIDLDRRFRPLTESELARTDPLADWGDFGTFGTQRWADLLDTPRIVLLAEAGSGKTWEMEAQVRSLRRDGKAAFFFTLEALARAMPSETLSADDERAFDAWIAEGASPGWFFLDSVDELKLTGQRLHTALIRFAKALDGHLHRARVWVSSRPSDWRAETDLATLLKILPYAPPPIHLPPPEDAFLAPLREVSTADRGAQERDEGKPLVIVALVPLNPERIKTFAVARGLASPAAFMAELDRQDAWRFARRPLDLSDLLRFWQAHGRLGTRTEQHEANVSTKLRDDPERRDAGVLSECRARSGAERLALALALTRHRTILYPETHPADADGQDSLDPASVLPNWTPEARAALLRRALFDPATYGRVRFHHRSVQEYLAACRLRVLRGQGMSVAAFLRLFVAERYGCAVVIPSRAPIAVWCALWSAEIRRAIMDREPELLLQQGDPGSLPIEERSALLRAFVSAYSHGEWCGLSVDRDAVRRLSHADLTATVRELWDAGSINREVSELLLMLIWQGPLPGCADIAHAAAFDTDLHEYIRILAIWALSAVHAQESLRQVAQGILNNPEDWPDRVVIAAAPELFPKSLTVDDLVVLIERTPERRFSSSGFEYAARGIALEIDPSSDAATQLREELARLIWDHRDPEIYWIHLHSRFGYLAPALAVLCLRQLESTVSSSTRANILRCAVIAIRFGEHEIGVEKDLKKLRGLISQGEVYRPLTFWQELALLNLIAPGLSDLERCFSIANSASSVEPSETDHPWLMRALANTSDQARRGVALAVLVQLWQASGRPEQQFATISEVIADSPELLDRLTEYSAPPQPHPVRRRLERRNRRLQCLKEARERERLRKWEKWRADLCAGPETAFSGDRSFTNIANLHSWLGDRAGSISGPGVWSEPAIRDVFGALVARAACRAFMSLWREGPPLLWSQRVEAERNSILYVWLYGLTGLYAEAQVPGWSTNLSNEEAQTAAAFAVIELNGFPGWLSDLADTHPQAVDLVLGKELSAQLAMAGEIEHISILQDVSHAALPVKQLFAPRIMDSLGRWPATAKDDQCEGRSRYALDRVLDILCEVLSGEDRESVAALCRDRATARPIGQLALGWLRGLFLFDTVQGVEVLDEMLAATPDAERGTRAVDIIAALFNDRGSVPIHPEDPERRAMILGRLVQACFRYVAPQDDLVHDGAYSPSARDDAERARGFVLKSLSQTPGADAHRTLLELAHDPALEGLRDHLPLLARDQAARDAEPSALSIPDLRALDERFESPPRDRDGLFETMMDRLADLQHAIAHGDFTDRPLLQSIQHESDMQRTLAWRIEAAARGAYSVCREEAVADEKKPDIRLRTMGDEHRAAIEIKITDNASDWSVRELEAALRDQLVGQYLRAWSGQAGCLLLTYGGRKNFWQDPDTGARLDFDGLCARLKMLAREIEAHHGFAIRLGVCGLDLRGPLG